MGIIPSGTVALGIGAYNLWVHGRTNPEQVWAMANYARAEFILPVHHSTFRLSREPIAEPMGWQWGSSPFSSIPIFIPDRRREPSSRCFVPRGNS